MILNAKELINRIQREYNILHPIGEDNSHKLKSILISMLADFDSVAKKHAIDYILAYGSVLGAIRHKGFIPWDDDLDIYLSRDDWNKLKNIFSSEMEDKYILEGPGYNDKLLRQTFGKIYLKGTELVEFMDMNSPYTHSIYIDIFVLDNVSTNPVVRIFDSYFAKVMKFVINSQTYYKYPNPVLNKIKKTSFSAKIYFNFRATLGFLTSFASHSAWCNWFDEFFSRHHSKTGFLTQSSWSKEIFESSIYFPPSKGVFEGLEVNLPRNPDLYLKKSYGDDYMQIPPKEKRENHLIVSLNFGNY